MRSENRRRPRLDGDCEAGHDPCSGAPPAGCRRKSMSFHDFSASTFAVESF